jgi:hypothetical protein
MLSVIVTALFFAGCGRASLNATNAEKVYYTDADEQLRLKQAMQNAGIPFELRSGTGGREEIWYESRFSEQVRMIRDDLFGVPPPMGRSIALGPERTSLFVQELEKRNATFRRAQYHGDEYIAWGPESDEAADAALQAISVNADGFVEMKRIRQAADAEETDRTNRSSRSREERAPAER